MVSLHALRAHNDIGAPPAEGEGQGKEVKAVPTVYVHSTVLRNVQGRIQYATDPARQEYLLGSYDSAAQLMNGKYWKTLSQECQRAHQQKAHTNSQTVEGRELILKLSNALLDRQRPDEICRMIAESFEAKYHRPVIVALHYNKAESNLHAHIIFAEREILPETQEKIAPRNLFFDEDGKRQYKKAKVLDDNGQLRPGCRIVAKGEVYERRSFGPAAPEFAMKTWMNNMKETWALPLLNGPLHGDMEYKLFDPSTGKLSQQHVGKNLRPDQADAVREYNALVMEYNALIDEGRVEKDFALEVQQNVSKAPRKASVLQEALETIKSAERLQEATEEPLQAITANAEQRSAPEPEEDDDLIFELLLDLMHRARTRLDEEEEPEEESETQQEQSSATVVWVDMINLSVSPLVGYYAIDTDGRLWVMDPQPQIESPQLGDKVDPRKGMRLGDEYDLEYLEKKLGISDREQPRDGLQAYIESIQRQEQPKDALQQYIELIRQRKQHKPSKSEEIDR